MRKPRGILPMYNMAVMGNTILVSTCVARWVPHKDLNDIAMM